MNILNKLEQYSDVNLVACWTENQNEPKIKKRFSKLLKMLENPGKYRLENYYNLMKKMNDFGLLLESIELGEEEYEFSFDYKFKNMVKNTAPTTT